MMKLRMRKGMAMLVALCMLIMMIPVGVFASTFAPTDITGHWAETKIQNWINEGWIAGYTEDNTFKPDQSIKRAEFMRLVNVAFDYTAVAPISYTDVQAGSWYYNEVAKAEAAGYIHGYGDSIMKPEAPITREEVATIIFQVKKLVSNTDVSKYSDAASIKAYSVGYVGAVTAAVIMQGYPDGTFRPQGNIKRGETVEALDNALNYVAPVVALVVDSVSAINGTTISVTFEGVTAPVEITLATALVDGATKVTFTYEGVTYTDQALDAAYVDPDVAAYAELKAGVDAKVAAYTALADGDLSTQVLVDATKAAGALVDLTELNDADKTAAQATVDAAAAKVTAAQTSLDLIASAETAVAAYEVAPIATAADVIAAEALGTTANEAVNAVTNTDAKTGFESRVATEAALVAAARTTEETKAVALINNSTVFNILARLQAPILNLQGIDIAYAAEYQVARKANFTTTKALIQSNVIDFVKTAADATLKSYIDPLNLAVSDYVGAINAGAQDEAILDMDTALETFDGHFELTDYATDNDAEYMAAFVSAGTLSTLEQVQGVITQVNDEVQLAADVTAAQTSVEELFADYDTKAALDIGVDQDAIDAALLLVNALDNAAAEKAGLLVDIQDAQVLLDATNLELDVKAAQDAVAALEAPVAEQQDAIDAALVLVNDLPDAVTEKAGLSDDIQIAQIALNIVTAQDAVTELSNPVTEQQDAIDAALVLVNGLDNAVTEKAGLLVDIQTAQGLLDSANLGLAQDAVVALFTDYTKTVLDADQAEIDAALVSVNVLDNAVTEKAGLLVDVQDAQDLLDAANLVLAQDAVDALFVDPAADPLVLAADQAEITAAFALVNVLDDAVTEKAGLLVDVQDAQALLDAANELILVTGVNEAVIAGDMETALTNLDYAPYINLGSAKRAEVSELFLTVEGATVFETQAEVELAIDAVISQYNALITNVNNAGTIVELRNALQAIVDTEAFTLANLTDPVGLTETEIVSDEMQTEDFTTFKTIADIDASAGVL